MCRSIVLVVAFVALVAASGDGSTGSSGGSNSNSGSSSSSSNTGSNSGPSSQDCTLAMRLLCVYSGLPLCGATQWPVPQGETNNCCPNFFNCRLPPACNATVVNACPISSLPQCAEGVAPTRADAAQCCPLCRRREPSQDGCNVDPSTLPRCAEGVVPTVGSNGCLSCRPPEGRVGGCNATALQACKDSFSSLPECTVNQLVERLNQDDSAPGSTNIFSPASCCLTCKPNYNRYCNETTIRQCHANHDNLPVCAAGQAQFVATSCCRQCRRDPATWVEKPDASGKCSATAVRQCFRKLPVCQNGERPFVDATRFCCPECRRQERTCSLEDVVRCKLNQPDCATGELPSFVAGECCATCKPVRIPCFCEDPNLMCLVPSTEGGVPTCAPKKTITFTLTPAATNLDRLRNAAALEIAHLLREMIARFCDQNENDARCQRRATQIRTSQITGVANADGSYTVTVTYPEVADDPVTTGGGASSLALAGNVFATDSNGGLYIDAAANAEAGAGYTVTEPSAAFATRASFAFMALSAILAMAVARFF